MDVGGECGGAVKVIACSEDPVVMKSILTHVKEKAASAATGLLPSVRAGSIFAAIRAKTR
jgi:hypothetical protein